MVFRTSSLPRSAPSPLDVKPKPVSMRLPSQARTIDRVRGEFREMRGFSPTLDQAARLFDLPRDECDRVLRSLVSDGSLRKCEDGRYRLI